jgi:hypothetical protein
LTIFTMRAISKYEQTSLKFGNRCPFVAQISDHAGCNLQHLLDTLAGRPCCGFLLWEFVICGCIDSPIISILYAKCIHARAAPGPLRRVLRKLLYHPDERLEPAAINQPLTAGEMLPHRWRH